MTKCVIEGHYYKIDFGSDCPSSNKIYVAGTDPPDPQEELKHHFDSLGITYRVKCARCGDRIIVNDKCYEDRRSGVYKL